MNRQLLLAILLTGWTAAERPPTQLMYLSAEEELKLVVLLKRQNYTWPVMRVGVGKSGPRWFGHIRFWVGQGAGRSEMLRQGRQAALLAFRLFPQLYQLDVDAAPQDDTSLMKARPWFTASLRRDKALNTSLELPPLHWFQKVSPLVIRKELHAEGDAAQHLSQQLLRQWNQKI